MFNAGMRLACGYDSMPTVARQPRQKEKDGMKNAALLFNEMFSRLWCFASLCRYFSVVASYDVAKSVGPILDILIRDSVLHRLRHVRSDRECHPDWQRAV